MTTATDATAMLQRVVTERLASFELSFTKWASEGNTRGDTGGREQWVWVARGVPRGKSVHHRVVGEHPSDPVAALSCFWEAWDQREEWPA